RPEPCHGQGPRLYAEQLGNTDRSDRGDAIVLSGRREQRNDCHGVRFPFWLGTALYDWLSAAWYSVTAGSGIRGNPALAVYDALGPRGSGVVGHHTGNGLVRTAGFSTRYWPGVSADNGNVLGRGWSHSGTYHSVFSIDSG